MSQNKELGVCVFFNSKNKNKLTATFQLFFFKMTHPHYANSYIYIQYTIIHNFTIYDGMWGKAVATYPQEFAQDAACQSHTGRLTRLWFLPNQPTMG